VFHPNRAAAVDTHPITLQRLQTPFRQRPQLRHLYCERGRPPGIPLPLHDHDELPVLFAAGKISAATQQQALLHCLLEMAMRRFRVTVLMPTGGIGRLALNAVMRQ